MTVARGALILLALAASIAEQTELQYRRAPRSPGIAFSRIKNIHITRQKWRLITSIQYDEINRIKTLAEGTVHVLRYVVDYAKDIDMYTRSLQFLVNEQMKEA